MRLTIAGPPRTKKNSPRVITNRKTGRPVVLPSEAYVYWASKAIPQLMQQWHGIEPLDHPFGLKAIVYRERNVGDLVNYLQAICDVLQDSGVTENDKWVQSFDGSRLGLDCENPRVELFLFEID